jgi:hypothetical protein
MSAGSANEGADGRGAGVWELLQPATAPTKGDESGEHP